MTTVSPVIPGLQDLEISVGKGQEQYEPIPALVTKDGKQLNFRFTFSQSERDAIINGADLFISVLTFNKPFQPHSFLVSHTDPTLTQENLNILKAFGIEE